MALQGILWAAPRKGNCGASPGDTIQLLHLFSVPELRHLPMPRHSGSKRTLHPHCPGFSFKHILSLINSFEAFCIYCLLASNNPLLHPVSGGRVIASGKQRLCYYLFLTHCWLEVGRGGLGPPPAQIQLSPPSPRRSPALVKGCP